MDKPNKQTGHREKPETMPAAGPHAKPELTDPDKTPGAGTLPPADKGQDGDATADNPACRTLRQTTLKTSISTAPGNIERQARI